MEECPACSDRWLTWETARRLDEMLTAMLAGEVEATIVAAGIKVALITTAAGLVIAIPVSIGHNYFVSRIDRLVIDMEESAQRTIDHLHNRSRTVVV